MFREYIDVRNWLENFVPYTYSEQNLGLQRIEYLLKLLGNPQKKFKSILVGGTSGKGSTAFYIAKLLEFAGPVARFPPASARSSPKSFDDGKDNVELRAVGIPSTGATRKFNSSLITHHSSLKVGLHLSPHLVDIRERMQINEELISPMRFKRLIGRIRPIVEKIQRTKPELTPSYFEILVAASFLYFAQEKVDWAVVEVGLGGRLDATNVLQPKIALITNVGLDHTEILGNTVDAIAYEKAGIIKKGILVVTGARGKALKVIKSVVKAKKARLIKVDTQLEVEPLKTVSKDYFVIYRDIERYIGKSFASSNFLLALTAVLALEFRPRERAVLQVSQLALPGRLEQVERNVILDGAHNVNKVKFLINWIKNSQQLTVSSQLTIVLAFKKGKDWKKIVDLLINNLPVKKVIATKFNAVTDMGRFAAVEPKEIAAYVQRQGVSFTGVYSNSQEAVFEALNDSIIQNNSDELRKSFDETQDDNHSVLVAGSLYLVGEARTLWLMPEF